LKDDVPLAAKAQSPERKNARGETLRRNVNGTAEPVSLNTVRDTGQKEDLSWNFLLL
jgi:hypothetical protein